MSWSAKTQKLMCLLAAADEEEVEETQKKRADTGRKESRNWWSHQSTVNLKICVFFCQNKAIFKKKTLQSKFAICRCLHKTLWNKLQFLTKKEKKLAKKFSKVCLSLFVCLFAVSNRCLLFVFDDSGRQLNQTTYLIPVADFIKAYLKLSQTS